MFVKSRDYNNYIQKVRIDLTKELGLAEGDAYVTLREPTTKLIMEIQRANGDEESIYDVFKAYMPELIIDHNFYESEDKKMKKEAVVEVIYDRMTTVSKIFDVYFKSAFFQQART